MTDNSIQVNDQTSDPSEPVTFYRPLGYSADVFAAAGARFASVAPDRDLHFGIGVRGVDEREYIHIGLVDNRYALAEVRRDERGEVSLDIVRDEHEMMRLYNALLAQIARIARGEVVS